LTAVCGLPPALQPQRCGKRTTNRQGVAARFNPPAMARAGARHQSICEALAPVGGDGFAARVAVRTQPNEPPAKILFEHSAGVKFKNYATCEKGLFGRGFSYFFAPQQAHPFGTARCRPYMAKPGPIPSRAFGADTGLKPLGSLAPTSDFAATCVALKRAPLLEE
jgi:hypothetical protein